MGKTQARVVVIYLECCTTVHQYIGVIKRIRKVQLTLNCKCCRSECGRHTMSLVVSAFMGQYRKNSDLVSGCDLKVVLDRDEYHPRFQCRQHLQFLPVLSTLPPYLHHVGRGPVSAARRGFPGRELQLQMGLIDLHDGRGRGKNWELYEAKEYVSQTPNANEKIWKTPIYFYGKFSTLSCNKFKSYSIQLHGSYNIC